MMDSRDNNSAIVTDHQISLYYFIQNPDCHLDYKNHDLQRLGLPERITRALCNTENKNKSLWERNPLKPSKDFLATIHKLFDSSKHNPIVERFTLNDHALKSLNGQQSFYQKEEADLARQAARLCLPLNQRSVQRLQLQNNTATELELKLSAVEIYVFKTGFKVARVNCQISNPAQPTLSLLTEAVYKLSKVNALCWKEPECHPPCTTNLSMGKLVRTLLNDEHSYSQSSRVYTDTYIQLQQDQNRQHDKTELLKLARHYTADYHINIEQAQELFIQDFDNITHCIAPEGSATLVLLNEHSPHFLKDYKNKVRLAVFTPMQLLAFHENHALQYYLSQSTLWVSDDLSDKNLLNRLNTHQQAIQNFSLNFQQPVFSKVSMHNHIYAALRKVQHIDAQLDKAKQDNQTIRTLITDFHQQKNAKRYCRLSKYGISAVAFLTAFTISKEVLEVIIKLDSMTSNHPHLVELLHHWSGAIHLTIASAIMLTVFFVERWHCKNDTQLHPHGPSKHLIHELIKHFSLNKK